MDSLDKDFFIKCFLQDLEIEFRHHLPNEGNYDCMLHSALHILGRMLMELQAKGGYDGIS